MYAHDSKVIYTLDVNMAEVGVSSYPLNEDVSENEKEGIVSSQESGISSSICDDIISDGEISKDNKKVHRLW